MKRNIIRKGDRVKVVNPEFFIRCGYPMTKEDVLRSVLKTGDVKKIEDFLSDFGIYQHFFAIPGTDIKHTLETRAYTQVFDRVADALAYGILAAKRFGGRERKVFTEKKEQYLNAEGTVVGRKVVNSGYYQPGWSDEYEGEPAYLTNQKTHVIFDVELDYNPEQKIWYPYTCLQIEKTNLQKL
jgi:hypothetical protein